MAQSNSAHNGNLIPIVKMIKGWNRTTGGGLSGLYLEFVTREILAGVTISNDWSAVRFVFGKGIERIKKKVADPAGFNNFINPLKTISLATAVQQFTVAYNTARAAEQADLAGQPKKAFELWKAVFGSYFPSYG
jgi:hypothetical protein